MLFSSSLFFCHQNIHMWQQNCIVTFKNPVVIHDLGAFNSEAGLHFLTASDYCIKPMTQNLITKIEIIKA